MTTPRLNESSFAAGLPARIKAVRPDAGLPAVNQETVFPQPGPASSDSVTAVLPGSAATSPTAVAFVDSLEPTPGKPPLTAMALNPVQLIQKLIQQAQAKQLSQSIGQHQAAVELLAQIHLDLDQGISLEDAFYRHFHPADFEHLLNQAHTTPQQVLQWLADSARAQVTPAASAAPASALETSARQLAGEVLQLTHELETRSDEMTQLVDSSSQKRQQATVASQELQYLQTKNTAQTQQMQALIGFMQQVATGTLASCQALLPPAGPALAAAAVRPDAGACAPLPSVAQLELWGVAVSLPEPGQAVFAVAGEVVSESQLVVYLSHEEQKQQSQQAANQQAIAAKQQELKRRQFELALIEQVLSGSRKGVAVLAQTLAQKREALLQSPAVASVPDYAQLLVRSARALAASQRALTQADQELAALQRVCQQLELQLSTLAHLGQTPTVQPVYKPAVQFSRSDALAESVPKPALPLPQSQAQSWDKAFLAQVEAENHAIQREQLQDLRARQLNQQLTDQQFQHMIEARIYAQRQREQRWAV